MSHEFSNSPCFLIPGVDGDLKVVHLPGAQTIPIDVQAAHADNAGHIGHGHSFVRLNCDAVCELRALLDHIDEAPDPGQAALWSPATFTEAVLPPARNRRRRAI
jgi:hypothetical protein